MRFAFSAARANTRMARVGLWLSELCSDLPRQLFNIQQASPCDSRSLLIYVYADFGHKAFYPTAAAGSCPPPRLIERLNEASCRPQTNPYLCSAGFGKTMFLSEWVAGCGDRGYPSDCSTVKLPENVKASSPISTQQKTVRSRWEKHGTCSGLTPEGYLTLSKQLKESITIPSRIERPRSRCASPRLS